MKSDLPEQPGRTEWKFTERKASVWDFVLPLVTAENGEGGGWLDVLHSASRAPNRHAHLFAFLQLFIVFHSAAVIELRISRETSRRQTPLTAFRLRSRRQ